MCGRKIAAKHRRYVILDVFSRYVTGWMVAMRESAELAKRLIEESCKRQGIRPGQLTLHADRGTSTTSKSVALLLADLGVTKTHSRPHIFDDNPFSESHFRTLKYRPEVPDRFGCIQHSRGFCQGFFRWYNEEHCHSSLGLLTPAMVHYGQAASVVCQRQAVLDVAQVRACFPSLLAVPGGIIGSSGELARWDAQSWTFQRR